MMFLRRVLIIECFEALRIDMVRTQGSIRRRLFKWNASRCIEGMSQDIALGSCTCIDGLVQQEYCLNWESSKFRM